MNYGSDYKSIPMTSIASGHTTEVKPGVIQHTLQMVNIFLVENIDGSFVLIDAGMPNKAQAIIELVEEQYGKGAKPQAILLTHGHFDHVGSIIELIEEWHVPVYAHTLELPYLTGVSSYPDADPMVEGSSAGRLSFMFPKEPIDLTTHVRTLPQDGTVPYLDDYKWLHTPGHSPGHVSYYNDNAGLLIAGDAITTTDQDSLYKAMSQKHELNGPPRYFTPDWQAAKESVRKLNALQPKITVTGHGMPMAGEVLAADLQELADQFDTLAKPKHGKYV
ncbi:MBL fold metallo-hydrolase [Macrococcus brunensis]|uniref:MBL fold metallo-hydrolase n=1 Tax=Macrococcus brunensis TaxID=198483 RepID=UPI001EEFB931|nr:MBL fold metallo-hydrolase [Macrococcus brunensis]ULG72377.1 MBL fold metallo-hydrolase [Macrococcus brunensis]ULG74638.1 MBL fold metallo-hydrolase [Macrococcus brunensis]